MKNLIKSKLDDMTPIQRKIADYILDHPNEIAFMTASELGEKTDTSEASVVRFTSFLGFYRYQEFRAAFSNMLLERLSISTRLRETSAGQKNNPYLAMLEKDIETLESARINLSVDVLNDIGKKLACSNATYIAAFRSSYAMGYYLSFYLSWLLPQVHLLSPELAHEVLKNAPQESIVLGISFPRYSKWTIDILHYANKCGLPTVAITDKFSSSLSMAAQYTLIAPYQPISFIDSFATPLSVINCLIVSVAQYLQIDINKQFEDFENLWHEINLYDKKYK
ncbi:MAG: MurR/RpiR family transcriptional regulator [Sporomusa sp.]